MRYSFVLPFLLVLFMGIMAALSSAQEEPDGFPYWQVVNPDGLPKEMIDGNAELTVGANVPASLLSPQAINAVPPSDTCVGAPKLTITPGLNEGVSANIAFATQESTDPELSCLEGNPTSLQGYRTVWYELDALPYNRVLFDTFSSGYDTVVSVYKGTCGSLELVGCNDDAIQFTSQLQVHVDELPIATTGEQEKYYVQIADWNFGLAPDPTLRLSVIMDPVTPAWESIEAKPALYAISRHAVVAKGRYIYVVGGQTGGVDLPVISNELRRFDTVEQRWADPGVINNIPSNSGYSNTTAVVLNDAIYLPSGFNGTGYDNLHWKYDINGNFWKTVASIPTGYLPKNLPFGWAAAAAHPSQLRYYLTGGMTSTVAGSADAAVSRQVYSYTPSPTENWSKLTPMQAGRYAHTAAWISQGNPALGLCVVGGLGTAEQDDGTTVAIIHSSMECYNPSVSGASWVYKTNLQIPRYGAGSVVGPDGKWYVFGGKDANHEPVAQTEVYNPSTNSFAIMEPEFDLGRYDTLPARFWPRGAMVGNNLWVIGGSIEDKGEYALAAMDRMVIPSDSIFVPFTSSQYDDLTRVDDSFDTARQMGFGGRQYRNFDQQFDFYDFYTFNVTSERRVNIDLEVPANNNFNLDLYGQNKLLWGSSRSPIQGDDEHISLVLQPRRYFIMVSRAYPTGQPDKGAYYTLRLN